MWPRSSAGATSAFCTGVEDNTCVGWGGRTGVGGSTGVGRVSQERDISLLYRWIRVGGRRDKCVQVG